MRIAVVVLVTVTSAVTVSVLPRDDIDEVVDPPVGEPDSDWYSSRSTDSFR